MYACEEQIENYICSYTFQMFFPNSNYCHKYVSSILYIFYIFLSNLYKSKKGCRKFCKYFLIFCFSFFYDWDQHYEIEQEDEVDTSTDPEALQKNQSSVTIVPIVLYIF